jgi:hypothetical protein
MPNMNWREQLFEHGVVGRRQCVGDKSWAEQQLIFVHNRRVAASLSTIGRIGRGLRIICAVEDDVSHFCLSKLKGIL